MIGSVARRVIASSALALALALVAGCSSNVHGAGSTPTTSAASAAPTPSAAASTPPAASSTPAALPDACSLLTPTEAEAVARTSLRTPVGAGASGSDGNTLCQFTGPTTGPTAQVEVYVGDGAKKQLDIDRDELEHTVTSVADIGDQCVQEDDFIFVEKNGLWASVHLVRLNDAQLNVAPLQTAMRQVAARLP